MTLKNQMLFFVQWCWRLADRFYFCCFASKFKTVRILIDIGSATAVVGSVFFYLYFVLGNSDILVYSKNIKKMSQSS